MSTTTPTLGDEATGPATSVDDAPELTSVRTPLLRRMPLGWVVLTGILLVLMLLPMISVQVEALQDGGGSYSAVLSSGSFGSTLRSTLLLGVGSVVIALVVGTVLAWCALQLPRRLRFVSILPMVPLMTPGLAVVTGWAFLLAPQTGYVNQALRLLPWWSDLERGPVDVYSEFWIIVITGTLLISFVYLFVLTALRAMDATLLEAARTCGASSLRTWLRVVLPMLRPSLIYSAAIVLLLGLGQFTAPLLLGRDANVAVLTTEMYAGIHSYPIDYGMAAAYGSPLIVIGLVLLVLQRRATSQTGHYESLGVRGHRSTSRRQGWLVLPIVVYVLLAVVLPLLALANVALAPFYSGAILKPSQATLDNFRNVLAEDDAREAVVNSVTFSVVAMLVVLPLSYFVATALTTRARIPTAVRGLVDGLTNLPLVMPGVLFGAGILFAYSEGPIVLYGTGAAVVLAYVTIMVPHVTRLLQAGMIGAGRTLSDVARVHGASPIRTHLRVMVPLLRPALASSAAVTFSILTHEFSASSMVRSTGTDVMGTLLFSYWTLGSYPNVAVMALLMCGITVVLVTLAYSFGWQRDRRHGSLGATFALARLRRPASTPPSTPEASSAAVSMSSPTSSSPAPGTGIHVKEAELQ